MNQNEVAIQRLLRDSYKGICDGSHFTHFGDRIRENAKRVRILRKIKKGRQRWAESPTRASEGMLWDLRGTSNSGSGSCVSEGDAAARSLGQSFRMRAMRYPRRKMHWSSKVCKNPPCQSDQASIPLHSLPAPRNESQNLRTFEFEAILLKGHASRGK